jgi:phage shock protein B
MTEIIAVSSPFTMVVLIVAIVFGAKIWRTHMLTRARVGRSSEDEALLGSMQAQIDRLTERVQVLEKLVTDDDRNLAREIDRLRDPPRPSP